MSNEKQESAKRRGSQSSSSTSGAEEPTAATLAMSNADYDHIRNTTLMFFLDRLFMSSKQDGLEVRTLHDLSCLFGTKGFTKEMRQIVGASRNGLKKFLQSYPSLFTVDGDQVYLTQLKQEPGAASARDYQREAVDYFTQKLLQFGASLVPIRNLFGYRSQASQEVRHVSGKSTKEFRQFLQAHDDVFAILDDEHVVLRTAMKELEERGETHESLQHSLQVSRQSEESPVVMDSYLNKQFARAIQDIMKRDSDGERVVSLGELHEKIQTQCSNQLFLKMVKSVDELRVFLRMHPKLFKRVDEDHVSLVTEEERREMELKAHPQAQLRRSETDESSSLSSQATADHHQCASLPPQQATTAATTSEQPMSLMPTSTGSNQTTTSNSNSNNSKKTSGLRATAPPFVPSTHLQRHHHQQPPPSDNCGPRSLQQPNLRPPPNNQSHLPLQHQQHQHQRQPLLQRSVSNLTTSSQQQQRASRDPRAALRSYLIKANQTNSGSGLYSPQKMSNGAQVPPQQQPPPQHLSRQNSNFQAQDSNSSQRTRTVNIVREASSIITRVMNSSDAVAFDCKGYNLGFNGQITLIQFAFLPNSPPSECQSENNNNSIGPTKQKPEVCIFDMITNEELAYCLKPLLESEKIVKIVHDVRNKSNALFNQFGIMLKHVFDTQVANLVIQQQETGKPAYKSRYISMSKLCEIYGDEHLMKYRNSIKSKTRYATSNGGQNNSRLKDVNYWRSRPLTDAMVYESTMDVYCLVGGVYQNLKSKIKPEYQPLFEELNLEGVLARIKPDEIRSVKKERKIDLEVIDLKRKLYSDTTRSIVLSNREIRLLRHVDLTEEVRQKIQQCKKVAKKLERLDMKAAQNAQSLLDAKSINSQASGDTSLAGDASLQPTAAGTNETTTNNDSENGSQNKESDQRRERSLKLGLNDDDDDGTGMMSNLMDSSMFDELKDKMIESSSLLESLEDDDEDDHEHHHHSHDSNCTCLCHHQHQHHQKAASGPPSSTATDAGNQTEKPNQLAATSGDQEKEVVAQEKGESSETDQEDASVESRAVDMAVQCDLLS